MRSPVSTLPSVLFFQCFPLFHLCVRSSYGGVVVITTAQLHSTKTELRFCAGSNPAHGVSEICDGEDLWQWSRLEIRLNAFRRSTIPQKQFIIIIIIITIICITLNEKFTDVKNLVYQVPQCLCFSKITDL